jgi:hypothetical protein
MTGAGIRGIEFCAVHPERKNKNTRRLDKKTSFMFGVFFNKLCIIILGSTDKTNKESKLRH